MEKKIINVRSFAWYDILKFYRYRRKLLCADSAQILTQGNPLGPLALLNRLHPAMGIYTGICPPGTGKNRRNGKPTGENHSSAEVPSPLIGQMKYIAGRRSARIVFLMPSDALSSPRLSYLLEAMAVQAGEWGAFHLLAEVNEDSCALEGMRRCGFAVYAWQRIWQVRSVPETARKEAARWEPATSLDENAIRNLYHALVPPLVQSAEPLPTRRLGGWVYRQEDEVMAYVEGIYGPRGIYLQPLIHPAIENVSQVMAGLLVKQPRMLDRPIYVAIRSYQAWLETVIRDLECQVGPRQALMVKHLVLQQRVAALATRHSMLEKYSTEPTVPLVQNSTSNRE